MQQPLQLWFSPKGFKRFTIAFRVLWGLSLVQSICNVGLAAWLNQSLSADEPLKFFEVLGLLTMPSFLVSYVVGVGPDIVRGIKHERTKGEKWSNVALKGVNLLKEQRSLTWIEPVHIRQQISNSSPYDFRQSVISFLGLSGLGLGVALFFHYQLNQKLWSGDLNFFAATIVIATAFFSLLLPYLNFHRAAKVVINKHGIRHSLEEKYYSIGTLSHNKIWRWEDIQRCSLDVISSSRGCHMVLKLQMVSETCSVGLDTPSRLGQLKQALLANGQTLESDSSDIEI